MCAGQAHQGPLFVVFQTVDGGLCRVHQGLRVRQAGVLGVQFVPLVSARGQLVDFANLPGQPFAVLLNFAFCRCRRRSGLREQRGCGEEARKADDTGGNKFLTGMHGGLLVDEKECLIA